MSYLSEGSPWLSEGDILRNRAAFADVAQAVHTVLSQTQYLVSDGDHPEWLGLLVRHWQQESSTVLTFNYDVLVESAWSAAHPDNSWLELYPVPLAPAASRVAAVLGGNVPSDGMRLLKLHGSLNWYYSGPGGPPGDVVYDIGLRPFAPDAGADIQQVFHYVSDRQPFIVPPASVKSPYYGNQTLHALWREAADALSLADEVVVMGFSFPTTDLIVSALLATSLRPETKIVPVDPSGTVAEHLRSIFELDSSSEEQSRIVETFSGTPDPIYVWVSANVQNRDSRDSPEGRR